VSASLTFDGRVYCALHPDVALARVLGIGELVCVVCRTLRAAQLEAVLSAGNDFDYPTGLGHVLHYVAELETGT